MSNEPDQVSTASVNVAHSGAAPDVSAALVALTSAVLPVWGRQLATSRTQSEVAVAEMLAAFAEIGPHLNMATRQSAQISAALDQGEGGIAALAKACEQELAPLLPTLAQGAADGIRRVMTMIEQSVDALNKVSKPFEHETQMINQQVERMYVGFQYQDRISQMMTLLHEDILRLISVMASPAGAERDLAPQAWLNRLESLYAMQEQRQEHSADTSGTAPADNNDETTFF
jgi:hypothetical protein